MGTLGQFYKIMTTKKYFKLLLLSILIFPGLLYSQKIESFSISTCDKKIHDVNFINERIVDYELISDTLIIVLDLVENCALQPIPTVEIQNNTLHIGLNQSSNITDMCECCYELRLVISGVNSFDPSIVKVGNKTLIPEENKMIPLPEDYVIIDTTTFNQMSKSGLKTGHWREKYNDKSIEVLSFYKVIGDESKLMWRKIFDMETRELKSVLIKIRNDEFLELTPRQYEEILKNY